MVIFLFLFFFFGNAGVRTQNLAFARQALYHLSPKDIVIFKTQKLSPRKVMYS
jgi:hypothetical protein